jgi:cold shock CspA family protein
MTLHGEIVRLEPALGFGFLRDDTDDEWFFVTAGIRSGRFEDVWIGERVGFTREWTAQGPRATDIHAESTE